ncbi:putative Cell wall biogenesis glycosyltransferase [Candidatus Defluviicoccus seviourii]|uniref:Cell wall biogenesis glycosyltransferase n=1 Tax=Candidatus Defluviicoccus seviourii TaxID=2565273 RepID=A0A564WCZ7_9PROT|nr:putative Cell wall biogenesis glycosyltransferase [Candidatus Defluviicoccus seviourii]
MPSVTVVVASYNSRDFLGAAVNSVLQQTFQDFELIIVDDCSTDGSFLLAKSISELDGRIRVLRTQINSGPASARNLAIKNAHGEWLAILDADDVWLAPKLALQMENAKTIGSRAVLVGSSMYQISEAGERIDCYRYPTRSLFLKSDLVRRSRFPPHSSLLYRLSTVMGLGGFRERFRWAEDLDLWLRMLELGDFSCISEPLIEYRNHRGNVGKRRSSEGFIGLDFGLAAMVCYLLRSRGLRDPSFCEREEVWGRFMNHVHAWNVKYDLDGYSNFKIELRGDVFSRGKIYARAVAAARNAREHPSFFWRFIREKADSLNYAERCCNSWIAVEKEVMPLLV